MGNVLNSDILVSDLIAEADLLSDFAELVASTKLILLGSAFQLVSNDYNAAGKSNYVADTSQDALPLEATLHHESGMQVVDIVGQFVNYKQPFADDQHSLQVWGRKNGRDIGVRYTVASDGTGFQAYPDEDTTEVHYTAEDFA